MVRALNVVTLTTKLSKIQYIIVQLLLIQQAYKRIRQEESNGIVLNITACTYTCRTKQGINGITRYHDNSLINYSSLESMYYEIVLRTMCNRSQAKPEVRRELENERMSLQLINDTISRLALAHRAYWSLRVENYKETWTNVFSSKP